MPVRALRLKVFDRQRMIAPVSESINARKGIKTNEGGQASAREGGQLRIINARKGIKTLLRDKDSLRESLASESINARKGIKT